MTGYPPVPSVDEVERHFSRAVRDSRREEQPYRHWSSALIEFDPGVLNKLTHRLVPIARLVVYVRK